MCLSTLVEGPTNVGSVLEPSTTQVIWQDILVAYMREKAVMYSYNMSLSMDITQSKNLFSNLSKSILGSISFEYFWGARGIV